MRLIVAGSSNRSLRNIRRNNALTLMRRTSQACRDPRICASEIPRILSPNDDKHRRPFLFHLPIRNKFPPIVGDSLQIDAVRVCRFDFNDHDMPIRKLPEPIKPGMRYCATVSPIGDRVAETSSYLVHNVLKGETTANKRLTQALVRIPLKEAGWDKCQELAEFVCGSASIEELPIAGECDDLIYPLIYELLTRRRPEFC